MHAFWNGALMAAALSVAGCATLGGRGPGAPFASDDEFRTWFAYYYKDHDPDRLTPALLFMKKQAYLKEFPDIASVFVGKVIATDVDHLDAWYAEWAPMGTEEWDVLLVALWLSDTPEGLAMMKANLHRATAEQRSRYSDLSTYSPKKADLIANDVSNPRQINMLWAAFSATGDERYVRKVVSYVHYYGAGGNGGHGSAEALAGIIGEAAIMTLANNVPQHPIVEKVCQDENQHNPNPKTRLLLQTMFNILAQLTEDEEPMPAH